MNSENQAGYIRVIGARDNNLNNVSVDIPKHRITVFTGVSGSGKSSLVFDTIAAESQRLVNETYPGFVQGFMQSQPRPNVDHMEGLTAAVIVGQEPMAANSRSTFGTATDITASLRVLFSRIAQPHIGGPAAYSFNVPSMRAQGAVEVNGTKHVRRFERTGGMCPTCEGTGRASDIDLTQLVDESKSLDDGAIIYPGMKVGSWMWKAYAESGLYPADKPVSAFTDKQKQALYYGDTKTKVSGINMTYVGLVRRLETNVLSKPVESLQKHMREFVERAVVFITCPDCHGTRLAEHAHTSTIGGVSIADVCAMELSDAAAWIRTVTAPEVAPLVDSIGAAMDNAVAIGLGYLTLDRPTATLSGGEAQRTRMVRHLGSALTDVTYVFDEPTAGLHPADVEKMNELVRALRDKGNTVLVVEHKPATIAIADYVVDMGPHAGSAGGNVVFRGTVEQLRQADTLTGRHLADKPQLKDAVRSATGALAIRGARRNNLDGVDVDIPTGVLAVVSGVAGSGKSSLVDCLPSAQPSAAGAQPGVAGAQTGLGADIAERILLVDQSTIKGSRRSNAATYTGALDSIRKAFAKENPGTTAALFSANSEGACPECSGAGVVYVELGVMSGVDVPCQVCEGRRFADDVLAYQLGGLNIAQVLDLPVREAAEFFRTHKVSAAAKICATLDHLGLGYITLGQPLNTLSGGERQRLKLAVHLGDKKSTADIVVLDEPTTGLHLADIEVLLGVMDHLVDTGHTVIAVEHHLAVIAHADHVIDLGPGAGKDGGRVVAACTPRELSDVPESITGQFLKNYLES